MKRALTLTAAIAALAAIPTSTAQCQSFCGAITCYGPGVCPNVCTCIQPNGPGTQGWCN